MYTYMLKELKDFFCIFRSVKNIFHMFHFEMKFLKKEWRTYSRYVLFAYVPQKRMPGLIRLKYIRASMCDFDAQPLKRHL